MRRSNASAPRAMTLFMPAHRPAVGRLARTQHVVPAPSTPDLDPDDTVENLCREGGAAKSSANHARLRPARLMRGACRRLLHTPHSFSTQRMRGSTIYFWLALRGGNLPVLGVDPDLLVDGCALHHGIVLLLVLLPDEFVLFVELAHVRNQIHLFGADELGAVPELPSDHDEEEDGQTDVVGEEGAPVERKQERVPALEEDDDGCEYHGKVRQVRLQRRLPGERVAVHALGLHGLHESDVRNQDADPRQTAEHGHGRNEVRERLRSTARQVDKRQRTEQRRDRQRHIRHTTTIHTSEDRRCLAVDRQAVERARCDVLVTVGRRDAEDQDGRVDDVRQHTDARTHNGHHKRRSRRRGALLVGRQQLGRVAGHHHSHKQCTHHVEEHDSEKRLLDRRRHRLARVRRLTHRHRHQLRACVCVAEMRNKAEAKTGS
ncbi:hypothetical protein L1887_47169 [Cichorium endivia]|nr:hypothetical protein L1887_47169 [Cichorium endivia]